MSVSNHVADKVKKTRLKLDERFSSFERSLFKELSDRYSALDTLSVSAAPEEAKTAEPGAAGGADSIEPSALQKELDEQMARNRDLESAMDRLRNNLKDMGLERQQLAGRIHELEDDLKKSRPSEPGLAPAGNLNFKIELERIRLKRAKSARFWRKWKASRRRGPKEDDAKQVAKLTQELDSAIELIAELRDELHSVNQ